MGRPPKPPGTWHNNGQPYRRGGYYAFWLRNTRRQRREQRRCTGCSAKLEIPMSLCDRCRAIHYAAKDRYKARRRAAGLPVR